MTKKQKSPATKATKGFTANEWYEGIMRKLKTGELSMQHFSVQTRLALARYAEAKRLHESLKGDAL